jgi:flagellum-specific ATP synthase
LISAAGSAGRNHERDGAARVKKSTLGEKLVAYRTGLAERLPPLLQGEVANLSGLAVDVAGLCGQLSAGDCVTLRSRDGRYVPAEVVGFKSNVAQTMAFAPLDGLGPGSPATAHAARVQGFLPHGSSIALQVSESWLGRIVDPLGRPLDRKGALRPGHHAQDVRAQPPQATMRARLGPRLDLGVRALNAFTTCRAGQRLALLAGSGVGKSTLLSMLARYTKCDVAVLALIGERGREVREFVEDELGAEGLARSVVVVATSDAPPLMRRQAAYAAMTIAEHFRDEGRSVLLMMDSVTRFLMALREIGVSVGEFPAARGYPPSAFAELPRLLERAGPGLEHSSGSPGYITGLFTVLVEGDDHNEPVADAVRGILDGHVVLDRRIAEAGRFPAVDVLKSLSRTVPGCNAKEENELTIRARSLLAMYADVADLLRLGAYQKGSDPATDEAIRLYPRIDAFLRQGRGEHTSLEESFARLRAALDPTSDST